MALIDCKDCAQPISRSAFRCPKCGGWQTVKLPKWAEVIGGFWAVGLILVAYQSETWAERWPILIVAALPALLAYGFSFAGRR